MKARTFGRPALGPVTLGLASLAMATGAEAALTKPVRTDKGLIQGVPGKQPGVSVFKGIPFAAPPVGPLRWRAPQPAAAWTGVRDGSKYGKVCMQPTGGNRINAATDLPDSPGMSEDCLTLNVWTPAARAGEKRPVMVWIYGGAYNEGGGSAPFSEGDELAKKGVVLVTFNYRVGAFGFLSHPELTAESGRNASGNQALMDTVAALKWIKANIAQFGGDPNNVTTFGESAGACLSAAMVGSPEAKGLVRRAISESGAWMGLGIAKMMPRETAEAATVKAAAGVGAKSLAELRALPAEQVLKMRGQGMIVDGWIVPEDFSKTFAEGRQNKMDVLVGSNGEEGSFTAGAPVTAAAWREQVGKRWGNLSDVALAAYPAATDAEATAAAPQPFSDTLAWHMRFFAESQARVGAKAYLYWFKHRPPYDPGVRNLGSAHSAEIPYVFNDLAAPRTFPGVSSVKQMAGNPAEEALADQISSYWVNFARTGDPNGAGLPRWPRMDELGPNEVMVLETGPNGSGKAPWIGPARATLFDRQYARDVGIGGRSAR